MTKSSTSRTAVGIVGAGPAGLMLAHLLRRDGIDSVAVDTRTRRDIETTHRAGILERDSVRLPVESGVSDRVLTDGHEHRGIDLRCDGDVRFGVADTQVSDVPDCPLLSFTDADGCRHTVTCDNVDGSRGISRHLQCDPGTDVAAWSDDRIWGELQRRLAGPDGFELQEGPICEKAVLPFCSFVEEPMRHGNLMLDAFDTRRQLGELDAITSSEAGSRYLAEGYTGWPTT